jgi:membrane-associated phospholipid phosphatase
MTRPSRIALLVLSFVLAEGLLIAFVDRPLSNYMRDMDANHPHFIDIFRAYTDFAKSKWYLWPSGFGILFCAVFLRIRPLTAEQRARIAACGHDLLFLFACVGLSGILTDMIKPILGRTRPVEMLRDGAYGFDPFNFHAAWNSMPSGHATTAAALACSLILLYPQRRFVWLVLGVVLASSRVMVNAHYLSDVLAGVAVGILTTVLLDRLRARNGMFPFTKGFFPIDKGAAKP